MDPRQDRYRLRVALRQLDGQLSGRVKSARRRLLDVLAYLTATIDFTEQEVPSRIWNGLSLAKAELQASWKTQTAASYSAGNSRRAGGRPNVASPVYSTPCCA